MNDADRQIQRQNGTCARLPEDFCDEMPFTMTGKHKVIGNGVPLPLGREIAKAVDDLFAQRGAG